MKVLDWVGKERGYPMVVYLAQVMVTELRKAGRLAWMPELRDRNTGGRKVVQA